MNDALTTFLIAAGVAIALFLIIFGAILAHQANQRRLAALRAFAEAQGWTFDPRRDRSHDDRFRHFEPFQRGSNRFAYNTMSGPLRIDDRAFGAQMGDFHYQITRSTGKSTSTTHYRFSYLILRTPFARLPDLRVRREHVLDKLAGAMGFDDIDFESAEFSRKFHVQSRDKRFAYDLITADMMEYLLAGLPGALELERGDFIITDGATRWSPEQYPVMVAWAVGFFRRWPRHTLHALDESHGRPT